MLTTIAFTICVPLIGWAVGGLVRHYRPTLWTKCSGVALQTVIVIVVLLAIAGAVAGVLLSRGGEAVAEAEQQEILVDAADITNKGLCQSYGFIWADGVNTCYRTLPSAPDPSTFTSASACTGATHLGIALNYTWDDKGDSDPNNDECIA